MRQTIRPSPGLANQSVFRCLTSCSWTIGDNSITVSAPDLNGQQCFAIQISTAERGLVR